MANAAPPFVPKGFYAQKPPTLSDALAARMQRLPAKSGPQRILAVRATQAKAEAVDAFMAQDGLWAPRAKAPGVVEVNVMPDDIARFTERQDLFAWIDAGTRLFGKPAAEGATVEVEVAFSQKAPAEKKARALGGTIGGARESAFTVKLPAAKIADLLKEPSIEAVEVK